MLKKAARHKKTHMPQCETSRTVRLTEKESRRVGPKAWVGVGAGCFMGTVSVVQGSPVPQEAGGTVTQQHAGL